MIEFDDVADRVVFVLAIFSRSCLSGCDHLRVSILVSESLPLSLLILDLSPFCEVVWLLLDRVFNDAR
jgi:hypothetical protein